MAPRSGLRMAYVVSAIPRFAPRRPRTSTWFCKPWFPNHGARFSGKKKDKHFCPAGLGTTPGFRLTLHSGSLANAGVSLGQTRVVPGTNPEPLKYEKNCLASNFLSDSTIFPH